MLDLLSRRSWGSIVATEDAPYIGHSGATVRGRDGRGLGECRSRGSHFGFGSFHMVDGTSDPSKCADRS